MSKLKRTPLYEEHVRLGAKMVDFAGWEMPVQYTSILDETRAVRENVGVFDVSHMGEIFVKGVDAIKFVDYIITNDFTSIKFGEAVYSPMCNEKGGIIDDLIAFKVDRETAYLVVNAANIEKDYGWIKSHESKFNVKVENRSDEFGLIAVQGPKAEEILQQIVNIKLSEIGFYHFAEGRVKGVKAVISRTGYTGEDGFEVMVDKDATVTVWRDLLDLGVKPAGLGARDLLRLEASYLLYGNDMNDETNPLEAGLKWTVKFGKADFIGKSALLEVKEKGLSKILVGMVLEGRNIARHGYKVFNVEGEEIGKITSGSFSPTLNKSIAFGYVKFGYHKKGTQLIVKIRNKDAKAEVVKLPFYRGSVKSKK
ncbi:MAG: glycine cleavage system aminomethyltransferase GcvT [Thermotogaceae bacterium]|nr:glycine cleavage system aminomethyltransferase GcvT [Thermotogaceae bacterium]